MSGAACERRRSRIGGEERHTQDDQQHGGGRADRDRVALHPFCEAVEAAGDVGDGRRGGDLAAEGCEDGGQERDCGGHADQDDAEAGDAERGEDRQAEHEQAAHRDGDGERREHDGLAGGRDGLDDGVVQSPARGRVPRGSG